ncbi:MAG: hypothetical protein LBB89_04915 [Treponema sp.]|jgi:hypothetical protein|nr:hypothetical protein [Treponema sp.]
MKKYLVIVFLCLTNFINAQENIHIEENENIETINQNENNEDERRAKSYKDSEPLMGLVFSFSGFNKFRSGMGIFFGKLGSDGGHHPFGDDFGLLFEYNYKDNIIYNRFYYHITNGILLGGSMVIAADKNNINIGLAPEAGIGLSTLFKIFYRYNFYINNSRFNSYEIVFHLCLYKQKK